MHKKSGGVISSGRQLARTPMKPARPQPAATVAPERGNQENIRPVAVSVPAQPIAVPEKAVLQSQLVLADVPAPAPAHTAAAAPSAPVSSAVPLRLRSNPFSDVPRLRQPSISALPINAAVVPVVAAAPSAVVPPPIPQEPAYPRPMLLSSSSEQNVTLLPPDNSVRIDHLEQELISQMQQLNFEACVVIRDQIKALKQGSARPAAPAAADAVPLPSAPAQQDPSHFRPTLPVALPVPVPVVASEPAVEAPARVAARPPSSPVATVAPAAIESMKRPVAEDEDRRMRNAIRGGSTLARTPVVPRYQSAGMEPLSPSDGASDPHNQSLPLTGHRLRADEPVHGFGMSGMRKLAYDDDFGAGAPPAPAPATKATKKQPSKPAKGAQTRPGAQAAAKKVTGAQSKIPTATISKKPASLASNDKEANSLPPAAAPVFAEAETQEISTAVVSASAVPSSTIAAAAVDLKSGALPPSSSAPTAASSTVSAVTAVTVQPAVSPRAPRVSCFSQLPPSTDASVLVRQLMQTSAPAQETPAVEPTICGVKAVEEDRAPAYNFTALPSLNSLLTNVHRFGQRVRKFCDISAPTDGACVHDVVQLHKDVEQALLLFGQISDLRNTPVASEKFVVGQICSSDKEAADLLLKQADMINNGEQVAAFAQQAYRFLRRLQSSVKLWKQIWQK